MEIKFKNKTVLVTGGAGFIGGHLVEELLNLGAKVIVLDIKFDPRSYFIINKLSRKTIIKKIDITQLNKLSKIFTKYKIEYIFHLAALTIVLDAFEDPWKTFNTNIMGTVNILELARQSKNIKAIIIASSDKAYGELNKKKYIESDPLKGTHPYDVSKSATDLISYTYFNTYNLPIAITRFGNVYGEGDINFTRLIPELMKSIINDETFKIRSNGKFIRDYIYVKDVVKGYLLLAFKIEKAKGNAYNFGSKDTLSVLDLINIIEKSINKKIKYKIMNNAINEIPFQSLNYSKVKKLGWKPTKELKKIIKEIFIWYKEN